MEIPLLDLLRCPASADGRRCLSPLSIDQSVADPLLFPGGGADDILEAVLSCGGCGARYPVICGVPVLPPSVKDWIRGNYWFLLGFTGEMGASPRSIQTFLRDAAAENGKLPPRQQYDRRWSTRVAKFVSSYLISHHIGLENLGLLSPAQQRLAEQMADEGGPHEVLSGMLADVEGSTADRGPALDVGCSVGGMTARLAGVDRLAVGVDVSFESLVWARSLLKGRPGPPDRAPVFTEGDNRVEIPLNPRKGGQCEFVLASGDALPFTGDCFRVAASCNLIDVMEQPSQLLDEQRRLLKSGGVLLLSSPFLHTAVGVGRCLAPEGQMPADVLRAMLDEREFTVTAERENVPWVLYHYRRRLDFYQTFCLAARLSVSAGK